MRILLLLLIVAGAAGAAYLALTTESAADLLGFYDVKALGFAACIVIAALSALLLVLGVGRSRDKKAARPAAAAEPGRVDQSAEPDLPVQQPVDASPAPDTRTPTPEAVEAQAAPASQPPPETRPVPAASAPAPAAPDVEDVDELLAAARKAQDPEGMTDAIEGYRAALAAVPNGDPVASAELSAKLGAAHLNRARIDRALSDAQAAIEAYESAIAFTARMEGSGDMASHLHELGRAQQLYFEISKDEACLEDAAQTFAASAEVAENDDKPALRGASLNGQATVLRLLGSRRRDVGLLQEALIVLRKAVGCSSPDTRPQLWANTIEAAALTKEALARLGEEPQRYMQEAVAHLETVLNELPDLKPPALKARIGQHLERIREKQETVS